VDHLPLPGEKQSCGIGSNAVLANEFPLLVSIDLQTHKLLRKFDYRFVGKSSLVKEFARTAPIGVHIHQDKFLFPLGLLKGGWQRGNPSDMGFLTLSGQGNGADS